MKQAFKNAFQGSVLNRATPMNNTNPIESAKYVGNMFKKNYNPKDPFFVKSEEGRSINNLYSGYKLGGKGNLLMAGGLLGGGTLIAGNPDGYQDLYNSKNHIGGQSADQDVESLQSTRSDGLTYQAQVGTSNMVTPSGDLVFAMHKTRHYGQL